MPRLLLLIWFVFSGFVNLVASEPSIVTYRQTVGPPITFVPPLAQRSPDPKGRLIVVNWNVHVGHGDVAGLIDKISSAEQIQGFGRPEFVLLLEESFRQSEG